MRKTLKSFFLHKNKKIRLLAFALPLFAILAVGFVVYKRVLCSYAPEDTIKELRGLGINTAKTKALTIKKNDSLYAIVETGISFDSKIHMALPPPPPVKKNKEKVKEKELPVPMPEETLDEQIYLVVESQPQFPGGELARAKFLRENIIYPRKALDKNIQGEVYVSFIVEPSGELSNITLLNDNIAENLGEEAIRVVKNMPKWLPGEQRGHPVRVQINMPIKFSALK